MSDEEDLTPRPTLKDLIALLAGLDDMQSLRVYLDETGISLEDDLYRVRAEVFRAPELPEGFGVRRYARD